jgi:excisionase family DNA binding protein
MQNSGRDTVQVLATDRTLIVREAPGFATPADAAAFLNLSKAMVHKLIGEGKMPVCRYGRAVRIPWSWLKAQAGEQT